MLKLELSCLGEQLGTRHQPTPVTTQVPDLQSERGGQDCGLNVGNVLKRFLTRNASIANSELDKCKNYCTEVSSCWGCTKYCNDTCGWYAISECNYLEDGTNPNGTDVSQKPGLYVKSHKLLLNIYA